MKKKVIIITTLLMMLVCGLKVNALSTYEEWAKSQTNLKNYTQVDTEMRAVWVSTVGNMDMPRLIGTDEKSINTWKEYYLSILDTAQSHHLNTIIFQVRPSNDAFYPSKYNPWSEFLWQYGKDPGWDPLEWMIEVTHERGMEYHAWMNPYRASTSTTAVDPKILSEDGSKVIDYSDSDVQTIKTNYFSSLKNRCDKLADGTEVDNPVFATGEELRKNVVMGTGKQYVLNPAAEATLTHLENTIREVVENYNIDGIHFDDYFYPNDTGYNGTNSSLKGYTYSFEPYVDMEDYQAYLNNQGTLNIYDWRRENVNKLIKNLSEIIREANKSRDIPCAFGISPSGRWAPSVESCNASESHRAAEGGMDASCGNYYSYSDLFADTKKWVDEEWVDYILPQVYTKLINGYDEIVEWWSNAMKDSPVKLYVGSGVYLHEDWEDNPITSNRDEFYWQIRYNQHEGNRVDGYSIFDYSCILKGEAKADMNSVSTNLWKNDALTPIYEGYDYQHTVSSLATENKISETATVNTYRIEINEVNDAKAYAIYKVAKADNDAYLVGDKQLTTTDIVKLNLKGNKKFVLAYDENYVYYLATVSKDNTFYVNETPINFDNVEKNQPPVITLISEFKEIVLAGSTLTFHFKIEDGNGDSFTYNVYLGSSKLQSTDLGDGIIEVTWKTYYVETPNLKIKVQASDGKSTTTFETETFDIVEVCPHSYSEATCTTAATCVYCGETSGTALGHNYSEATCTAPETCSRCGEVGENALGHDYLDATCTVPETCSKCGETSGTTLGHTWQDATYDNPKTCSKCNKTEGTPLEKPEEESKGCSKCKKSMLAYLFLINALGVAAALLLKRRGK